MSKLLVLEGVFDRVLAETQTATESKQLIARLTILASSTCWMEFIVTHCGQETEGSDFSLRVALKSYNRLTLRGKEL